MSEGRDADLLEARRERFLEVALEEIVGGATPPDLTERVREAVAREASAGAEDEEATARALDPGRDRRLPRWPFLVAAAVVLLSVLFPWLSPPPRPAGILSGRVEGILYGADGEPATGATVRLELGFASAAEELGRRSLSVDSRRATTDAEGRFSFPDVPYEATAELFVSQDGLFARAPAEDFTRLALAPGGALRIAVRVPPDLDRDLRVYYSADGWSRDDWEDPGGVLGRPDLQSGVFAREDLPPGPGVLTFQRANWPVKRVPVDIRSGETTELPPVELVDASPEGPDPLVDARIARVVDETDWPMENVRLTWSSPWADGQAASSLNGEVRLFGGGVSIGGPPFLLRMGRLEGPEGAYAGSLVGIEGEVATVRLTPLRKIEGTLTRRGEPLGPARLSFRTGGEDGRVYSGRLEDGRYELEVPPGPGEIFVLTASGTFVRRALTVEPGDESLELDIDIGN